MTDKTRPRFFRRRRRPRPFGAVGFVSLVLAAVAVAWLSVLPARGADHDADGGGHAPDAATAPRVRHVLILNSYHHGYPWSDSILEGLESVLRRHAGRLEAHAEYMDTKRYLDAEHIEHFAHVVRHKVRTHDFAAVVVCDDNALNFALERRAELFGDLPIVFCGINNFSDERIAGQRRITGVVERPEIGRTIELALRLHPGARRLYFIGGETTTGRLNFQLAREACRAFEDRLECVFWEDMSAAEVQRRLRQIAPTDLVMFLALLKDERDETYSVAQSVGLISGSCRAPVYSCWDFTLGLGVVGGRMVTGFDQGKVAANLLLKTLMVGDGPLPPVDRRSPNRWMFDYEQLRRFDIPLSALPSRRVVINRPESFYAENAHLVWSIIVLIILQMYVISRLLMNIYLRRRAERRLTESEQRFRYLSEAAFEGIIIHEVGLILEVNKTACDMLGYDFGELIGHQSLDLIFTPEGFETVKRNIATKSQEPYETTCRRKDGSTFPVSIRARETRFHGRPVRVVALRDITHRKMIEENLRLFKTAADRAHYGVFIADTEGSLIYVNDAFAQMHGYDAAELVGAHLSLFYAESNAGSLDDEALEPLRRHGAIMARELAFKQKDGGEFTGLLNANILYDERSQAPLYISATVVDITEHKKAEAARQAFEAQMEQAQKLESLGVLAGGIAHDFNNLLVGILGNCALTLMDMAEDSPMRAPLEKIEKSARRAADLTRQMLAYSGKGQFIVEPLNLNFIVEEMANLLDVSISKKIVIDYDLAPDTPPIEADSTQVRQIVMNLITNASEAIGDNTGTIAIQTGALHADRRYLSDMYFNADLPEGEYAFVEVRDTGGGMGEETRARIFDPFFTTKFTGRGLGLAAVLGIIRGHRGAIKVDSEPGKGSTFRVLFPAAGEASPAEAPTEPTPTTESQVHPGAILVVDDEEAVRSVAKASLEKAGFQALVATNGREGVEVFRERADEICCVILDLTMPEMGGEEAFRELRKIRADVPVILSSGFGQQEATDRLPDADLAGFLRKPFDPGEIVGVARRACRK